MRNLRERIKLQGLVDRRALAALYLKEYGVKIENDAIERLTEKQLLIMLETRRLIKKETAAAIKI